MDDSDIENNFENAYLLNKEIIILGDINIDLLNANQSSKLSETSEEFAYDPSC